MHVVNVSKYYLTIVSCLMCVVSASKYSLTGACAGVRVAQPDRVRPQRGHARHARRPPNLPAVRPFQPQGKVTNGTDLGSIEGGFWIQALPFMGKFSTATAPTALACSASAEWLGPATVQHKRERAVVKAAPAHHAKSIASHQ